jgi:hypothetical protein
MKERIQINGIWYIRENTISEVEIDPKEITNTLGCVWESSNWAFIAAVILRDEAENLLDIYSNGVTIDITDKRNKNRDLWVQHDCDNTNWLLGILEGDDESMSEAEGMFDEQGIAEFKRFIRHLITKGWIVKE